MTDLQESDAHIARLRGMLERLRDGGEELPRSSAWVMLDFLALIERATVSRSEAEAAELLALRLYDLMRDDDAEHMTEDDVEAILRLREAHPRHPKETP